MNARTRILILGGFYAARRLERALAKGANFEITLVAHENFFLFKPMLHEVVGGLDPGAIVSPIRMLLRHTNVIEGEVGEVDLDARTVHLGERPDGRMHSLEYDQLVLAIGSESNFFNIPGLAERAAPMKTLADAVLLRNRLIATLEAAVLAPPEERTALTAA